MQTKIEKIDSLSVLAVKIIEPCSLTALDFLSFREKLSYANISHPKKQHEWASSRIAIRESLAELGLPYPGFFKDAHGKSHVMQGEGHVSLSHTAGIAAAIFHKSRPVGVDVETIRKKITDIGPRFLSASELDFLEKDPLHYTLAWSAKESIFKCQGKKGVSFRENIILKPFSKKSDEIHGEIHGMNFAVKEFHLKVVQFQNYVLTYTVW